MSLYSVSDFRIIVARVRRATPTCIRASVIAQTVVVFLTAADATADPLPRPEAFAQCAICHVTQPGQKPTIGPNLFGVAQRSSGALAGYGYSQSMKKAAIEWTPEHLAAFIAAPQETVPGTKMAFPGLKDAAKVKMVVDYLSSLK
jgi:cytochrome c2